MFLAHLLLNRRVIISPVKTEMALHVVQRCINQGLRKPTYILRRWRLVPFLSKNVYMLYCELIIYKESVSGARFTNIFKRFRFSYKLSVK